MRRTAVYRHDLFLQHQPGPGHPESPERLRAIYDALDNGSLAGCFVCPEFAPVSDEILQCNHSAALVKRVSQTRGKEWGDLDPDTRTSPRSDEAARLAAGALTDGISRMFRGEIDNAFCLVRPPGHHAEWNRSMGFCLYNNVAVAARWAMKALALERIMIVDWDLHHGNGTQESFYDTDKALYLSVHQYPYYPGTGAIPEIGAGQGEGYTVNVPLSGGQGDFEYARIFNELAIPLARLYQPTLILISCGFDIYDGDPLGGMRVTADGFAYMTRTMVEAAAEVCGGKLLVALEGGYNLTAMRDGSLAVLAELCGRGSTLSAEKAAQLASSKVDCPSLDYAAALVKNYWNL